jgi:hypothetical protein
LLLSGPFIYIFLLGGGRNPVGFQLRFPIDFNPSF